MNNRTSVQASVSATPFRSTSDLVDPAHIGAIGKASAKVKVGICKDTLACYYGGSIRVCRRCERRFASLVNGGLLAVQATF